MTRPVALYYKDGRVEVHEVGMLTDTFQVRGEMRPVLGQPGQLMCTHHTFERATVCVPRDSRGHKLERILSVFFEVE